MLLTCAGKWPIRACFAATLTAIGVTFAARPADAQDSVSSDDDLTPPVIPVLRDAPRKVIGFDFGIGAFDGRCANCTVTSGLGLGFTVGAQVARRLAVVADFGGLLHPKALDSGERGALLFLNAIPSARVWVIPTFWLQAGAGSQLFWSSGRGPDFTEIAPAAQLALGSELDHQLHRGIDLQLRAAGSRLRVGSESGKSTFVALQATVAFHWN